MYIWTVDKPQSYDRVDLPRVIGAQQVAVTRNVKNFETYTVFAVSDDGAVRYWPQTNRPAITQDIAIEVKGEARMCVAECSPHGIIVGTSFGAIHMVAATPGGLVARSINKSQGLLGYLYLAKQPPVLAMASTPQHTNCARHVYVLTETTLIKYAVDETGESVALEYPLSKEVNARLLSGRGVVKLAAIYVEAGDTVYVLLSCDTSFYLAAISVRDDQVANVALVDNFKCQHVSTSTPVLSVVQSRIYLSWPDFVYYFSRKASSGGHLKRRDAVICSGVWADHFHIIDRQNRVQTLTAYPARDSISDIASSDKPAVFDIPEEEDLVGAKRNVLLRTLNAYASKQGLAKSLEVCRAQIKPAEFDLAARKASYFIANQRPSIRHWAAGADVLSGLGATVSVQLKQQIADKRKRHALLLTFLQEHGYWNTLSGETQEAIDANERRIIAAGDLRDFQNAQTNGGQLLVPLIQAVVADRLGSNWTGAGMNVYELFYSQVTAIDDLLVRIVANIRQERAGDALLRLRALIEANGAFLKITKQYTPAMMGAAQASNDSVQRLAKSMVEITSTRIQADLRSGAVAATEDPILVQLETTLYDQLYQLTSLYLTSLRANDIHTFTTMCTSLIAPFVSSSRYDTAVSLANKFMDYRTLVQVYLSDTAHRADQLVALHRNLAAFVNDARVIDQVYLYMLESGMKHELLSLPLDTFGKTLHIFLEAYPQISWFNLLRLREWTKSSEVLLRESEKEQTSMSRKKTLISLAKIALLADPNTPENIEETIDMSNQSLEMLKIQKEFLPHQKNVLSFTRVLSRLIELTGPDAMVQ
eukprot:gene2630-3028_t